MITPVYTAKLGLVTQKTDIDAQKIDGFILKTYEIVLAGLSIHHRLKNIWFFEKTFLFANINMEMVLRISFFIFSDADFWFAKKELI